MVPLDVFGDIVCVVMPVMLSFDEINKIQKEQKCDLFPYVGLISENKKVLGDLHKDYKEWLTQDAHRREEDTKRRLQNPGKSSGDWMSIFDAGDAATQDIKKKVGAPEKATPSPAHAATPAPKPPAPTSKAPAPAPKPPTPPKK
jgi:hypothetical protein